jgi:hypothetical protein
MTFDGHDGTYLYTRHNEKPAPQTAYIVSQFRSVYYINVKLSVRMPLNKILAEWDKPVKAEMIKDIISYMKSMPKEQEQLVLQCAEHLDKSQSLGAVLAVAHALNEGEIFLRCRDDDDLLESELSNEFDRLLQESDKKNTTHQPLLSSHAMK